MLPSSDERGGSGSAETRLMNTKWAPIGFTEKSEQTTHDHQSLSIGKGAEVSPPVSLKRDITPEILVIKHRFRLFFCSTALSFCRQAETWESVRLAQQIKVLFTDALSDVQSFPPGGIYTSNGPNIKWTLFPSESDPEHAAHKQQSNKVKNLIWDYDVIYPRPTSIPPWRQGSGFRRRAY